jgi:hypothetical protein
VCKLKGNVMFDVFYVILTVVFFVLAAASVRLIERL